MCLRVVWVSEVPIVHASDLRRCDADRACTRFASSSADRTYARFASLWC